MDPTLEAAAVERNGEAGDDARAGVSRRRACATRLGGGLAGTSAQIPPKTPDMVPDMVPDMTPARAPGRARLPVCWRIRRYLRFFQRENSQSPQNPERVLFQGKNLDYLETYQCRRACNTAERGD